MYICRYPENHPRSTCCGIANVGVIEHQSASTSVPPAFFHPLTPHPLLSIGKPFPQELTDTRTLALVVERCHLDCHSLEKCLSSSRLVIRWVLPWQYICCLLCIFIQKQQPMFSEISENSPRLPRRRSPQCH